MSSVSRSRLPLALILLTAACSSSTATPAAPTNTPQPTTPPIPSASVEIVGEPEVVFDWSAGHCPEPNAPDLPVRPFRDAEGQININLSAPSNYRLVGPDFDQLELDCTPTLLSDFDPDPSHFNYSEWIGATYTLGGRTVDAIVHNEFYGDLASGWDSQRDFSDQPGEDGWSYMAWTGAAYRPMSYDA